MARNCGECLMERVEVIELGPDGVCPTCGTNYGPDADTSARLLQQVNAELDRIGPLELHLSAASAFQLGVLCQVSMRREPPDKLLRTAATLLEHVRAHFAACPAVLELLSLGNRP